jgi:hypothetical protein
VDPKTFVIAFLAVAVFGLRSSSVWRTVDRMDGAVNRMDRAAAACERAADSCLRLAEQVRDLVVTATQGQPVVAAE